MEIEMLNTIIEKLNQLEQKHDKLDAKINEVYDKLDAKINEVYDKLDAKINGTYNKLNKEIVGLKECTKELKNEIDFMWGDIKMLDDKIDKIIKQENIAI